MAHDESDEALCFSLYLYRAGNLIERFFTRSSIVVASQLTTTSLRTIASHSSSCFDTSMAARNGSTFYFGAGLSLNIFSNFSTAASQWADEP